MAVVNWGEWQAESLKASQKMGEVYLKKKFEVRGQSVTEPWL